MSICALATRWVLILATSPILLLALALQWTWSALTHEADWNKRRASARHRVVIPSAICLGTRRRTGELGWGASYVSKSGIPSYRIGQRRDRRFSVADLVAFLERDGGLGPDVVTDGRMKGSA